MYAINLLTPGILVALLAAISLSGCIELVPRDVEETISIDRDGKIEVTYQGTFNDLRELAKAVAADQGEKIPTDAELRGSTREMLQSDPLAPEVTELSPGIYRLRWHDEGALGEDRVPKLLSQEYGSEKIPRLLEMTGYRELSSSAYSIATIKQDDPGEDSELPADSRTAKVLRSYLQRFKGKVGVRVDPSMVLKHNATSATVERDGRLLLQWSLSMPMKQGVELLITLDKRDMPKFKLMDSPPGSSCMELIGSNCKCGPFRIARANGTVEANAPYEMKGPTGIRRGCTNSEGDTVAIESPVTGPCQVRLLPKSKPIPECEAGSKDKVAPQAGKE